jgi:hypothetical protein
MTDSGSGPVNVFVEHRAALRWSSCGGCSWAGAQRWRARVRLGALSRAIGGPSGKGGGKGGGAGAPSTVDRAARAVCVYFSSVFLYLLVCLSDWFVFFVFFFTINICFVCLIIYLFIIISMPRLHCYLFHHHHPTLSTHHTTI